MISLNEKDINLILKESILNLTSNLLFKNESEKIKFINKLEEILQKTKNLKTITPELKEIILESQINKETLKIYSQINWQDYEKIFQKQNENKINEKIYQNLISFLRNELNIPKRKDKILIENLTEIKPFEISKQKEINNLIFKKQENFDIENDLKKKLKKFKIDLLFDYTTPPHKLTVQDFILYFTKRLQYYKNLLKSRVDERLLMKISKIKEFNSTNQELIIIGLVSEIFETKKGHYIITLEDTSGEIKCFINKKKIDRDSLEYDENISDTIKNLCYDEGLAIRGKVGDDIIWVNEIINPTQINSTIYKKTEEENYIVFMSDIHFAAKVFVDEAFQKMLDFLNQKTTNSKLNEIAKKIKYIIIAGDIIDGIGIYPGQGKDTRILNTELQYHEAARWLSQIPNHISIIIIPGNHDTERLSEPQPKLQYSKAYALYNMENIIILSNPSNIELFAEDKLGPLNFYLYHGGSIFYYADKIKYLREKGGAKSPEEVIEYLLKKRHVAPSHGSTLYFPDTTEDPLVIKKMPDFFITGHTHKLSLKNYNNCTIISCGCWVEMSEYQEKMGMFPDIGKLILVNTKTRKPQILNFYKEKYKLKNIQKD